MPLQSLEPCSLGSSLPVALLRCCQARARSTRGRDHHSICRRVAESPNAPWAPLVTQNAGVYMRAKMLHVTYRHACCCGVVHLLPCAATSCDNPGHGAQQAAPWRWKLRRARRLDKLGPLTPAHAHGMLRDHLSAGAGAA